MFAWTAILSVNATWATQVGELFFSSFQGLSTRLWTTDQVLNELFPRTSFSWVLICGNQWEAFLLAVPDEAFSRLWWNVQHWYQTRLIGQLLLSTTTRPLFSSPPIPRIWCYHFFMTIIRRVDFCEPQRWGRMKACQSCSRLIIHPRLCSNFVPFQTWLS